MDIKTIMMAGVEMEPAQEHMKTATIAETTVHAETTYHQQIHVQQECAVQMEDAAGQTRHTIAMETVIILQKQH